MEYLLYLLLNFYSMFGSLILLDITIENKISYKHFCIYVVQEKKQKN